MNTITDTAANMLAGSLAAAAAAPAWTGRPVKINPEGLSLGVLMSQAHVYEAIAADTSTADGTRSLAAECARLYRVAMNDLHPVGGV